jgi:predicted TIM-barrel enzyme
LAKAARIASRYIDVVTTSGPGTGQAAALEKIQVMKEALDDFPLAIASGITPENAVQYLPWADCVLVATGISRTFEEFDPQRTQDLVNRVRSFLST